MEKIKKKITKLLMKLVLVLVAPFRYVFVTVPRGIKERMLDRFEKILAGLLQGVRDYRGWDNLSAAEQRRFSVRWATHLLKCFNVFFLVPLIYLYIREVGLGTLWVVSWEQIHWFRIFLALGGCLGFFIALIIFLKNYCPEWDIDEVFAFTFSLTLSILLLAVCFDLSMLRAPLVSMPIHPLHYRKLLVRGLRSYFIRRADFKGGAAGRAFFDKVINEAFQYHGLPQRPCGRRGSHPAMRAKFYALLERGLKTKDICKALRTLDLRILKFKASLNVDTTDYFKEWVETRGVMYFLGFVLFKLICNHGGPIPDYIEKVLDWIDTL